MATRLRERAVARRVEERQKADRVAVLSLLLVLPAVAAFVVGAFFVDGVGPLYLSIGFSVIAGVLLLLAVRSSARRRREEREARELDEDDEGDEGDEEGEGWETAALDDWDEWIGHDDEDDGTWQKEGEVAAVAPAEEVEHDEFDAVVDEEFDEDEDEFEADVDEEPEAEAEIEDDIEDEVEEEVDDEAEEPLDEEDEWLEDEFEADDEDLSEDEIEAAVEEELDHDDEEDAVVESRRTGLAVTVLFAPVQGYTRREQRYRKAVAEDPGLPIESYSRLTAAQVIAVLDLLDREELEAVRKHEKAHAARKTILKRIDQLKAETRKAPKAGKARKARTARR